MRLTATMMERSGRTSSLRTAFLLTGDRHEAEDLVQDASVLGCVVGTVKSQRAKALRTLRTRVMREETS